MDVHTPQVRSKNMRAIRNRNTKPELLIRKALHAEGFRFRLNVRALKGCPDIVLPKYKVLIFVHGCFWHGHQCRMFQLPKTRPDFWRVKLESNVKRDIISQKHLLAEGWRVATVWECSLRGLGKLPFEALVSELIRWIASSQIQTVEFKGTLIERISDT